MNQPGPNLTAVLNDVHAQGGDLATAVNTAFRDTLNTMFAEAVRDQVLARWQQEHGGNSLVAWLTDDNTIACVREMPTGKATTLAEGRDHILIIASWETS